ncbi:prolactin regulatory element-binding protein [Venturia canescens]|uniref:prolactin regulatory element-binding protein n=1 Tax=Venturia canescens TaxID=32260 RepID=UPI001C9D4A84|nr:prolactin regulatory element-binding protein [Venturia canescens]XP_043287877.1 prolactin regulatory element-binding protein [Venturia canescens]XP_043287878.1 prolactin regulatory element-binding protein [Venturia canescens]
MPPRRKNGCLLARVNFPLYTLQMLTSRHILVGGGGGSSKTGVANGFEIFELSHNGSHFVAEEVTRHETGPSVVMNCASYTDGKRTWLVAGQESHCQLYNVSSKVVHVENGEIPRRNSVLEKDGLRQRRKSERETTKQNQPKEKVEEMKDSNSNLKSKKLQLVVKPADSIQTDFGKSEALQRIVRISTCGKLMATGGTDGHIRIWAFPRLEKLHEIEAHAKEIDDIDFSRNSKTLGTIAKDGRALLWSVDKGVMDKELTWSRGDGAKYMYKRLRFARPCDDRSKDQLFTLSNSIISKNLSYLQLWDTQSGNILKSVGFSETLSAMAVSDDGKFVAVGTMFSGSVDIFIAFSLQRALHVQSAHSMFVTGLEFLPTSLEGPAITSNTETAVVSISVDNRICIHSIPFRHTLPFWLVLMFIILSICGAFVICSFLGI